MIQNFCLMLTLKWRELSYNVSVSQMAVTKAWLFVSLVRLVSRVWWCRVVLSSCWLPSILLHLLLLLLLHLLLLLLLLLHLLLLLLLLLHLLLLCLPSSHLPADHPIPPSKAKGFTRLQSAVTATTQASLLMCDENCLVARCSIIPDTTGVL